MNEPEGLTIKDLVAQTGFPSRSIHHYVSRGLLPGPVGQGPAARYGREHLLRLQLIEQAKRGGFKIDKRLQKALDGLSVEEMENLVEMSSRSSTEDVQMFGQWLLTGHVEPAVEAQQSRLEDRIPSTAEFITKESVTPMPADEPVGRSARDVGREPRRRESAERWKRYRVGDDLEISWRKTDDRHHEYRVERLLRHAERLFGEEPDF